MLVNALFAVAVAPAGAAVVAAPRVRAAAASSVVESLHRGSPR